MRSRAGMHRGLIRYKSAEDSQRKSATLEKKRKIQEEKQDEKIDVKGADKEYAETETHIPMKDTGNKKFRLWTKKQQFEEILLNEGYKNAEIRKDAVEKIANSLYGEDMLDHYIKNKGYKNFMSTFRIKT